MRSADREGRGGERELLGAVNRLRALPADELAAQRLDRILRPRLAAFFRASGNEAEADDLVQDTLRRVFSGVSALHSVDSFLPWLFTVARNVQATRGGQRSREPTTRAESLDAHDPPALAAANPEAQAIAGERISLLSRAIRDLPARQRHCLLLQVREELSYAEIGELLALSVLTVRNHLAQARAALRRALTEGPTR